MMVRSRFSEDATNDTALAGMQLVRGGAALMGSEKHYPEEVPAHRVSVDPFFIDFTPVTTGQFEEFARATGHKTPAEILPDPKGDPGALPHMLRAGALVFSPPSQAVDTSTNHVGFHCVIRRGRET